jgi:hypothetical protein
MIVTCVSNDPAALADHQRSRASAFETAYPLTPGRQYAVVGMSITETVFYLLVEDDRGQARFAPAGMFDLFEAPVPPGWRFALGSGVRAFGRDLWSDPVVATWGYPELVEDPEHFSALVEGNPKAVAVFTRRIAEAREQGV